MNLSLFFAEQKSYSDSREDWNSEGGASHKYNFSFQPDGSVILQYDSKSADHKQTASRESTNYTTYKGTYTISQQNQNTREININLTLASNIYNQKLGSPFNSSEDSSYQNKVIDEKLLLVENLETNVVTVTGNCGFEFFYRI